MNQRAVLASWEVLLHGQRRSAPSALSEAPPSDPGAATTKDSFPRIGGQGRKVFVGLRGMDRPDLAGNLKVYRDAWKEAGHDGAGDVLLRIPVFVGKTDEEAFAQAEESTMRSYRRMAQSFSGSAAGRGTTVSEERAERGRRLAGITYEDLLRDRLAYGSPDTVVAKLIDLSQDLGLSGVIAEMNVGGLVPREQMLGSVKLFADEVVPAMRDAY